MAATSSCAFYVIYALSRKRQRLIVCVYCNHSPVRAPRWSSGDKLRGTAKSSEGFQNLGAGGAPLQISPMQQQRDNEDEKE